MDVWANNGDVACERGNGCKEVSEKYKDAVQLDQEAGQWPAEEDEEDSGGECGSALELLAPGEKDKGLLQADDEGEANEEEDLLRRQGSVYRRTHSR